MIPRAEVVQRLAGTSWAAPPRSWKWSADLIAWLNRRGEAITKREVALERATCTCDRCGTFDVDIRRFTVMCMVGMDEQHRLWKPSTIDGRGAYTVTVCKGCRGDMCLALRDVLNTHPEEGV